MEYLTSWLSTAQVEISKNVFWLKDINLLVYEYLQEHYVLHNLSLIPTFIVEQKFQECRDILSYTLSVICEHDQHLSIPLDTYSIQHFQSKLNKDEYAVELSSKFIFLRLQKFSVLKIKKAIYKYVEFCSLTDMEYTQYLLKRFQKFKINFLK